MSRQQGCPCDLTSESSGYHLYIPCPECLKTHGRREVEQPKFSINVSKHLGLGDAFAFLRDEPVSFDPVDMERRFQSHNRRDGSVGICMRTWQSKHPHRYGVSELLQMEPVTVRHPDIYTRAAVRGQADGGDDPRTKWEEDPESGVLCPPPPGVTVPITELPTTHPAVVYLRDRGYDLRRLWEQFRCGFCTEEYPHGQKGIFYRQMPGGWRDTPQHRVIFRSMIGGAPLTWQARYPEMTSADGLRRFMLHPYWRADGIDAEAKRLLWNVVALPSQHPYGWSQTHVRANPQSAWMPLAPFDERDAEGVIRFQPSKYRTAKYSSRQLMGWDAALKRAAEDSAPQKWVVLCEGPLDAARVGPGGVALIGSSLSPDNAARVSLVLSYLYRSPIRHPSK